MQSIFGRDFLGTLEKLRMPKRGGVFCGGVCRHTKTAKTANGLEGRVARPVFLGPMSAVIAAGKKPPEPPKPSKPPKPSNATHPLDHTPPLQHLEKQGRSIRGKRTKKPNSLRNLAAIFEVKF